MHCIFNLKLSMLNFKIISHFTKIVVYFTKMDIYLEEQFKTFFFLNRISLLSYFKPIQRIWSISFIQVYWWKKPRSEKKVPLPYSAAGTIGILDQKIIVRCYPLHCRIFSSIPVLYPLDANSAHPPSSPLVCQANISPDIATCSLEETVGRGKERSVAKLPWLRAIALYEMLYGCFSFSPLSSLSSSFIHWYLLLSVYYLCFRLIALLYIDFSLDKDREVTPHLLINSSPLYQIK